MANSLANNFWIVPRLFQYLGALPDYCLTAGIFAKVDGRRMNMKLRYRLFLRRKSVYYAFDDTTKTFTSLKTKDKAEAARLLVALNEAGKQPAMNLGLARVYLRHSDPMVTTRTWKHVLD